MAEPLTNAILASILHLVRWDLAENRRVPPRRASPRWVPPHRLLHVSSTIAPAGADQGRRHPPIVSADEAITTKITRAVATRTATATIQYTLHPKDASRPWTVGWTTGRHHPVSGRTSENPYNRRRKKGVTGGGASDKGHSGSLDHRLTGNTIS
jgi:hypothetical protein